MSIPITPETRIAELLEAYPALEGVLLQQSPHFRHLKNPLLRKTVARVATLEKAAQMSGIPVRRLVAVLRDAAGLPGEPGAAEQQDHGRRDRQPVGAQVDQEPLEQPGVIAPGEWFFRLGLVGHAAASGMASPSTALRPRRTQPEKTTKPAPMVQ